MNNEAAQIKKAGAVVLHHDGSKRIALIFRNELRDWSFPKGHMEPGETPQVTCAREVKEETGLDIEILLQLPNNEYFFEGGEKVLVHMYLARSKGSDFVIENPGDVVEWVDIEKVGGKLTYDTLKNYYTGIEPVIENFIKITEGGV
jgi:8-oxo-dGTP pyrophosphatase MutT (NUDIX family)